MVFYIVKVGWVPGESEGCGELDTGDGATVTEPSLSLVDIVCVTVGVTELLLSAVHWRDKTSTH